MLIRTPKKSYLNDSHVTQESIYHERRSLLKQLGFLGAGALMSSAISNNANASFFSNDEATFKTKALDYSKDMLNQALVKTPEQKVISHNNFYEFGSKKDQPAELSQGFKVELIFPSVFLAALIKALILATSF